MGMPPVVKYVAYVIALLPRTLLAQAFEFLIVVMQLISNAKFWRMAHRAVDPPQDVLFVCRTRNCRGLEINQSLQTMV